MHPLLAKFCKNYFARFYELYSSSDEAAALGLGALTEEQQKQLAPILDEVTSERYSADDLVRLWMSSPADVWFSNGEQIRELLKMARRKIS